MSNYPPGVSGMEPEIAGLPEFELARTCDNESALYVPAKTVTDQIYWLSQEIAKLNRNDLVRPGMFDRVTSMLEELIVATTRDGAEFACEWDDKVDVEYSNGMVFWVCPRCGMEHEDDYEPDGPDPDRDYDNRE